MSLAIGLYALATSLAEPLAPLLLRKRAQRGKEDAARLNERLGRPATPRPKAPLIWLHGVSLGESLSLLPLIDGLRAARPDLAILVTSGTTTAAEMMARRLPPQVLHQYAPIDAPGVAARFFKHWSPWLGVLAESELWPNLILTARRRGVKLALVSARMTRKSAKGWARFPKAARALLGAFDLILAQDGDSRARLERLGARVDGEANLKLPAPPLEHDTDELARLEVAVGARPTLLAASTHDGEELIIAVATPPGALLIVAPRHPQRGSGLAEMLRAQGRRVALRSAGDALTPDIDVYIADTLGELGLFFRLADLVILGGSFVPDIGGHNPLEPARLGQMTLHGMFFENWRSVYASLGDGAVESPGFYLPEKVSDLMADPADRARRGAVALEAARGQEGVIEGVLARLLPLLPP